MLVLSRKPGERIHVGDDVTITIVRIGPNNVRVGIEAPKTLNIVREELLPRAAAALAAEEAGTLIAADQRSSGEATTWSA